MTTTYRVYEAPSNGTTGQDVGDFALADLPARLRAAVEADPKAGEWTLPALSGGDVGDELPDLSVIITARPAPAEIGTRIGKAIARDVLAEAMPVGWTGLDAQDGDQIAAAGYRPGSPEWAAAEAAAEAEYRRLVPQG